MLNFYIKTEVSVGPIDFLFSMRYSFRMHARFDT